MAKTIGVSVGVKGNRKALNLLKIQGFSWHVRAKKMHAEILVIQYFEPLSALILRTFFYVFLCFAEKRLRAKKMQRELPEESGISLMKYSKVSACLVYIILYLQRPSALMDLADDLRISIFSPR